VILGVTNERSVATHSGMILAGIHVPLFRHSGMVLAGIQRTRV
jgi:hypothetical protein